jgi:hypothetical protein
MVVSHARAVAIAVVVFGALLAYAWRCAARRCADAEQEEGFLPALIGLALTAVGVGAKVTGADKKVQDAIWKPGGAGDQVAGKITGPVVTYRGRAWDGADWSCPAGTVDTGLEDAKACITSQFHPPMWRDDGTGKWGHTCPWGTVATGEDQWEKKCEMGYMGRIFMDGKWQCPAGTTDTGNNWDKGWREGQKQCKRNGAYGTRMWDGKGWACPPGTKDTDRGWDHKTNGGDQCKFLAG